MTALNPDYLFSGDQCGAVSQVTVEERRHSVSAKAHNQQLRPQFGKTTQPFDGERPDIGVYK